MSEVDHPPGQTTVEAQIEKPAQRASEAATMIQEKPADAKSCAFPQAESFPSGSLFYYRVNFSRLNFSHVVIITVVGQKWRGV